MQLFSSILAFDRISSANAGVNWIIPLQILLLPGSHTVWASIESIAVCIASPSRSCFTRFEHTVHSTLCVDTHALWP